MLFGSPRHYQVNVDNFIISIKRGDEVMFTTVVQNSEVTVRGRRRGRMIWESIADDLFVVVYRS